MMIITLLAMLAISLLAYSDVLPKGSVNGPMTFALIFLLAALAVGIYEAWSNRRGVLGWVVSIMTAVVGGIAGISLFNVVLESGLMSLRPNGSLMTTRGAVLYLALNAQMIVTLIGAWIALWVTSRFR